MIQKHEVMGIDFVNENMDTFLYEMLLRIRNEDKTFVVTANPEILMYAEQDKSYEKILENANYVIPDGVGIIVAAKLLGEPLKERLTGFDFLLKLLDKANHESFKAYFLGAREEVLQLAIKNLHERYPQLQIVGSHHGYFGANDQHIVDDIQTLKPDIILLGLGFPRQEKWIYEHLSEFDKGFFIGLGGSFDVIAGKVKRAPRIWQKLNIEWLYRLIKQPMRWRRTLALPKFLGKVLKLRFEKGKKVL